MNWKAFLQDIFTCLCVIFLSLSEHSTMPYNLLLLLYTYYNDSLLSHLTIIIISSLSPFTNMIIVMPPTIMTIHNYYPISKIRCDLYC